MLDPFTIATSCISLINGITSLTMHITVFVNDIRGARKDMDLISRELISLSLCLGALRTDCQSQRVDYPEASRQGIEQALLNIDVLTQQIKDLLQKLSSGKLGRRIQWTMQSKDTVDRLRSSLETQKSTIEIALQCGSIQILCAIQKQVEKPAQDLSRLTSTTRAIREDTEALRKDAVDIKELIRQEAGTLRTEIAVLKHGKTLSTELQDFLRLSQDYSNRIADPFITPEQSDAGFDDPLTAVFSRSSLVSTPESFAGPLGTPQVSEQYHNTDPVCPSCRQRLISDSLLVERQARKPLSSTSTGRQIVRVPSRVSDEGLLPADDSIIETTVRCGKFTFNTTFSKNMEFSGIKNWLYSVLQQAEADRLFWIPSIKSVGDVCLTLKGSEMITYRGEQLSHLAQIYGFGSHLLLDTRDAPQSVPDFRQWIEVSPPRGQVVLYNSGPGSIKFNLYNYSHERWHAPIMWSFKSAVLKGFIASPQGGVLQCDKEIQVTISQRSPPSTAVIEEKLVLQAIVMKSEYDPNHWKRLILMTPESDRWECVLTCSVAKGRLAFLADENAKPKRGLTAATDPEASILA